MEPIEHKCNVDEHIFRNDILFYNGEWRMEVEEYKEKIYYCPYCGMKLDKVME